MLFPKYVSSVSRVFAENRLLKFVVLVLAALLVFSQIKLVGLVTEARTVIIPAGLTEKVELSDGVADENYLNAMGVYIATLMYSTTPLRIENQYRILLSLFDSKIYEAYSVELFKTAAAHRKNEVSQTLSIEKISIEYGASNRLTIDVNVEKSIFGNRAEKGMTRHRLALDFAIRHGRFYITDFNEERSQP